MGQPSHMILVCAPAGIVVDLFYQGEVLPQLQEVCDETYFSDYAAKLLVLPTFLYSRRPAYSMSLPRSFRELSPK